MRTTENLPITQTAKVQKRQLRAERWECDEPVFFRAAKNAALQRMTAADVAALRARFVERGRERELR